MSTRKPVWNNLEDAQEPLTRYTVSGRLNILENPPSPLGWTVQEWHRLLKAVCSAARSWLLDGWRVSEVAFRSDEYVDHGWHLVAVEVDVWPAKPGTLSKKVAMDTVMDKFREIIKGSGARPNAVEVKSRPLSKHKGTTPSGDPGYMALWSPADGGETTVTVNPPYNEGGCPPPAVAPPTPPQTEGWYFYRCEGCGNVISRRELSKIGLGTKCSCSTATCITHELISEEVGTLHLDQRDVVRYALDRCGTIYRDFYDDLGFKDIKADRNEVIAFAHKVTFTCRWGTKTLKDRRPVQQGGDMGRWVTVFEAIEEICKWPGYASIASWHLVTSQDVNTDAIHTIVRHPTEPHEELGCWVMTQEEMRTSPNPGKMRLNEALAWVNSVKEVYESVSRLKAKAPPSFAPPPPVGLCDPCPICGGRLITAQDQETRTCRECRLDRGSNTMPPRRLLGIESGIGIVGIWPELTLSETQLAEMRAMEVINFKPKYCRHCGHNYGCMCPREEQKREPVNRCVPREPKVIL